MKETFSISLPLFVKTEPSMTKNVLAFLNEAMKIVS